jgi:hypothetical protein
MMQSKATLIGLLFNKDIVLILQVVYFKVHTDIFDMHFHCHYYFS